MCTIYHQVGIRAKDEQVYQALTKGIDNWWTNQVDGNPHKQDSLFSLKFNGSQMEMRVDKLDPHQLVQWECTKGHTSWQGTLIVFSLVHDPEHQQTLVNFKHCRWMERNLLFRHCSTKWAVYLLSLKELLETGRGRPYPNDISINHNE